MAKESYLIPNSVPYNYRAYDYSISHWPLRIYIYIALGILLKCPLSFSILVDISHGYHITYSLYTFYNSYKVAKYIAIILK